MDGEGAQMGHKIRFPQHFHFGISQERLLDSVSTHFFRNFSLLLSDTTGPHFGLRTIIKTCLTCIVPIGRFHGGCGF